MNEGGGPDPEKQHTRMDIHHHLSTNAHIVFDDESGLAHTPGIVGVPAPDVTQAQSRRQAHKTDVFAGPGYRGVKKREEVKDLKFNWNIAINSGRRLALHLRAVSGNLKTRSKKDGIRTKIGYALRLINCQFGFAEVRCRGLVKNTSDYRRFLC